MIFDLSRALSKSILVAMHLANGSNVVADLTTIGRKSGKPRRVELRFLYLDGNFYATSSKVEGKHWCQNMIRNPLVEITVKGEKFSCKAKQVSDDAFRQRILSLRDSPPQMSRAVFEIVPQD